MELGIHLPQIALAGREPDLRQVREVAETAHQLGFAAIAANDHLAFHRPWLDGPSLLAAVAESARPLELVTTVALPTVRGPVQLAVTLSTLAHLAPGRVVAGVGAGSSAVDYALAGVPFNDRWRRFDESCRVLRALLQSDRPPPGWAELLSGAGVLSPPAPVPLWLASWGSAAGVRRVARLGDGWLASAYNTTPSAFTEARRLLVAELQRRGRDPDAFPAAVATMWTWIDRDEERAERVLTEVLAPLVRRPPDQLRGRVCVGSPEHCAALLGEYAAAGCSRVYLWPIQDEVNQLHLLAREVVPLIGSGPGQATASEAPSG